LAVWLPPQLLHLASVWLQRLLELQVVQLWSLVWWFPAHNLHLADLRQVVGLWL
jgi:hypothetical protein